MVAKTKVAIIGYGSLGQFLASEILKSTDYDLLSIYNRTHIDSTNLPESVLVRPLDKLDEDDEILNSVDIAVEVAHPMVTCKYGKKILSHTNYFIGSPTALADESTLKNIKDACFKFKHSIYIPNGAFWGGEDIRKMADLGTLEGLTVTMTKQPTSFKLVSPLKEKNANVSDTSVVLYEGPVRVLCSFAPNNVNTMAAACIAAHNLGFDKVIGRLVSDPNLPDCHIVQVLVKGKNGFEVETKRYNPARVGAVTGTATYQSFFASLTAANGKPPGIFLC